MTLLETLQRRAIALAGQNPKHPYAAIIADREGNVLAEAINNAGQCPTYHGEMLAIDKLFQSPTPSVPLAQCQLITTAEPCPMCAGAIFWSGIGTVAYGTSISTLTKLGIKQLNMAAGEVFSTGAKAPELIKGVLEAECNALFTKAAELQRR